jgi:hypothetical protein
MSAVRNLGLFISVGTLVLGMAEAAAAAPLLSAPPQAEAAAGPAQRYAFCYSVVKHVYYYSPIYVGAGGEDEQASFAAAVVKARGGPVTTGVCSSRRTAAEAVALRDERFARDNGVMTSLLPAGVRIAGIPEASTPRPPVRADGSAANPLILECASEQGQFTSMTRLYEPSARVLVKIAGPEVSIWRASYATWSVHPCVRDTRDGQFCSITPTRIWIKDAYELAPGATEANELDIDRRDGSFRFRNLLATPGVAPFIQSSEASGACRPTRDPAADKSAQPPTAF